MLHPSYSELMSVVNGEFEPGEQPVVQSRYSIVMATAKRAKQLIDGAEPRTNKNHYNDKPLSVAVKELYEGKISIIGDDE